MGAFFVGETTFEVVENVVLLGATLFLTGAFLGAKKQFRSQFISAPKNYYGND